MEKRELPAGWQYFHIGELCCLQYGKSLPERERINGNIKVYGSNGIVGSHQYSLTQSQTIIIGRKGSIGEIHYSLEPCYPIDTTYYIDHFYQQVDFKWFAFFLKNLRLNKLNKASGVPGLNRDDVHKISVFLPPLPEQQRIATILTDQLAAVGRARKASEARLEAVRALPAAYLREVFESEDAKGWPNVQIGEIANVSGGIQKTPDRVPVKFFRPYLTVRNVQRGFLDLSEIAYFEITLGELEKYKLLDRDLLIVEGNGSIDEIGRNALFIADGKDWIHQNHIIRVRLYKDLCKPEFISAYLNSKAGRAQMVEKAKTTSGLYTLSTSKVSSLTVPLPSINTQKSLVKDIQLRESHLQALNSAIAQELTAIKAMPSAFLHQAFTGNL